ncbi:MAG: hypothetical protein SFT92_04950 [Rickettsiales bacterium]|nr:hypothetical protein [Rickettsiales bacterium]
MVELNINWLQDYLEKARKGYGEYSSKIVALILRELESSPTLSNDTRSYLIEVFRKITEGQSPNHAFYFEFGKDIKNKQDHFMRDYYLAREVRYQMAQGKTLDDACEYVFKNIEPHTGTSKLRKIYSYFAEALNIEEDDWREAENNKKVSS